MDKNPETSESSKTNEGMRVVSSVIGGAVSETADAMIKAIPEPFQEVAEAAIGHDHDKPKVVVQEVEKPVTPPEKSIEEQLSDVRAKIGETKTENAPQALVATPAPDKV